MKGVEGNSCFLCCRITLEVY